MISPRIPSVRFWFSCLLVFASTFGFLHAAPLGAEGKATQWTQPDGTKLQLRVFGDEFHGRTETVDGYTVVFDPETKTYHYADLDGNGENFRSTGKMAGAVDPQSLGLQKKVKLKPEARAAKAKAKYEAFEAVVKQRERWQAVKAANRNYRSFKAQVKKKEKAGKKSFAVPMGTVFPDSEIPTGPQMAAPEGESSGEGGPEMGPPSFTLTGEVVGLTILVDFSDDPGTAVTQPQVDDYFNKPDYTGFGNSGSVYDYFFIQSGGRLRYNNNVTYYVRVPQPKSYYDDTSVDSGQCGRLLLNAALDVLIADGYDFSSLTTKSGGNVRACNIFFAGNDSGVWSKGLWPHRWVLSPSKSVGSGMQIYDYQITNIGTSSTLKIGTVCHENGHMLLGYPDLYSYNSNAANVGNFSLMASGNYGGSGYHPTNIDPYLKTASGWSDIVELDSSSSQRCTVQVDNNLFYRYLNPSESREYFMFEVRDNTGYEGPYGGHSGSVNPATGLLAYHLREHGSNTYSTIFTADSPNADYGTPYELLVLESNPSASQTPWYDNPTPGTNDAFKSSDKNQISDATTPSLKFWDASGRGTNSGGVIHSISSDSSVMTFVAGSGAPTGSPSISLSRANIYSSCNYGETAPASTFAICNGQGGTLNYTISDNAAWLSCSVASGSATTESDLVTVTLSTDALSSGSYTGTITVDDGNSGTATVTVNLTVWAQPTLAATSSSLSVDGLAGTSGPDAEFDLENIGGGTATYTITKTKSWLAITPASGSLGGERDAIYVNFDASSLSAGTYNDTITVTSSEATNSPLTIPVTFNVDGTEMLLTSPNGGEGWFKGTARNITWTSSLGGNVKIELLKNGVLNTTIAATTSNDGSHSWVVPAGQTVGTDYKIRVTTLGDPSYNDTSSSDFSISAAPTAVSIPYAESFESGVGDWVQLETDAIDWTWDSGGTPSGSTGPAAAQDGSYYLFTEASSQSNKSAQLTCWFDLTASSLPELSFYYHMYGADMGSLVVQASIDGSSWDTLFTKSGDQGNSWAQATADLSAYAGQYLQLKFNGTTGGSFTSDITIDNVTITQPGFTVAYNGNGSDGGSPPIDSNAYPTSSSVTVIGNTGNLIKTGYIFNGWDTAADGSGTNYVAGNSFSMGSSNVTLYAQWTAVPTYTISFNGNGHNGGSPPSNQTKTQGVGLTLSSASSNGMSRTGYSFSGWNTASNGSGTSYADGGTYTPDVGDVLYAQWTVSTYTVVYNGNTNTGGSAPSDQTKTYAIDLTLATKGSLVKTGHTFSGWNTAADGSGDSYASEATYSANSATTLYAQWSPSSYTVTFNSNGGGTPSPASKSVTYDSTYGSLATVSRTGYTFMGWFTSGAGGTEITSGTSVAITAAQTLYAQWNVNPVVDAGSSQTVYLAGSDVDWTPADAAASLTGWYDASDSDNVVLSGQNVTNWKDISGNGYDLDQSPTDPVYDGSQINGLNVIHFADTWAELYR
ncbi:MAG: M6 family metalloprotease domain-containing protein, partial [Verrucomicrobiae bacterium]|nr:M6 family metalloprotease domain-containing protein [Verrucomicrobiae bacterium]NNJ42713.1 M6 family metalloprotease domain-containing protein [Akkermansiaceae bacterium]